MNDTIIDYHKLSKSELIQKIIEQDMLINNLIEEKNNVELLEFPWVGNLGQWYWIVKSNQVFFNDLKVTALGYSLDEIPERISYQFFTDKIHPDDFEKVMDNMRKHLYGINESYEVEYRIKAKDGSYKWFYDRGKVTKRNEKEEPLFLAGIVFDITKNKQLEIQLEKANKELRKITMVDYLTGIHNRRKLSEILNYEIRKSNRTEQPLSIILFDIDKFKSINDAFGHNVGDKVLIQITNTVNSRIRETDIFCRFGGDEFIIILPNTDLSETQNLAEDIKQKVSEQDYLSSKLVSLSIGIVEFEKNETMDSLIKRADFNMYKAKDKGGNCVVY